MNSPDEDMGSNPTDTPHFAEIVERRLSRRDALRGLAATAAVASFGSMLTSSLALAAGTSTLGFKEVAYGPTPDHAVAEGYEAKAVIRWGDPIVGEAPKFDPMSLSAAAQARQFGYNNDFVGYLPLPIGSTNS